VAGAAFFFLDWTGPRLPPVTEEITIVPKFPRLSILNGCILAAIPGELKAVIEKGCYHVNLIKLVLFPTTRILNIDLQFHLTQLP
jgi:hypothetical protein